MPDVYTNEASRMTTRILGIDPSLVKSGFGLIAVRDGEIQSWNSWSFPTDTRGTIEDRITAIHNQVRQAIEVRDVHIVAMESGFVRGGARSTLSLAYVRAACMIAARLTHRPFFQYTPQQAKQAATSYGGAGKDQVRDAMTMILKASTRLSSDEADALAVAFCHWNRMDEAALISASLTAGRPEYEEANRNVVDRHIVDGPDCKWCGYPENTQHKDHKYESNDCMEHWHVQVHGQGSHCRSCGMTSVFTPNGMRRVIPCARGPEYLTGSNP